MANLPLAIGFALFVANVLAYLEWFVRCEDIRHAAAAKAYAIRTHRADAARLPALIAFYDAAAARLAEHGLMILSAHDAGQADLHRRRLAYAQRRLAELVA